MSRDRPHLAMGSCPTSQEPGDQERGSEENNAPMAAFEYTLSSTSSSLAASRSASSLMCTFCCISDCSSRFSCVSLKNKPSISTPCAIRRRVDGKYLTQLRLKAIALLFEERDRPSPNGRPGLEVLPPHVLAVVACVLPCARGSDDGVKVVEVLLHVVLLEQLLAVLLLVSCLSMKARDRATRQYTSSV